MAEFKVVFLRGEGRERCRHNLERVEGTLVVVLARVMLSGPQGTREATSCAPGMRDDVCCNRYDKSEED
jgi:hypothetical protein